MWELILWDFWKKKPNQNQNTVFYNFTSFSFSSAFFRFLRQEILQYSNEIINIFVLWATKDWRKLLVILVSFVVIIFKPWKCIYCVLLAFLKHQYYNFYIFSPCFFFFLIPCLGLLISTNSDIFIRMSWLRQGDCQLYCNSFTHLGLLFGFYLHES